MGCLTAVWPCLQLVVGVACAVGQVTAAGFARRVEPPVAERMHGNEREQAWSERRHGCLDRLCFRFRGTRLSGVRFAARLHADALF